MKVEILSNRYVKNSGHFSSAIIIVGLQLFAKFRASFGGKSVGKLGGKLGGIAYGVVRIQYTNTLTVTPTKTREL